MRKSATTAGLIESLEPRLLLSSTLSAKGTLVVQGGDGAADIILISRDPKRASKILATINGAGAKFDAGSVKRIEVYGLSGNDNVRIDDSLGIISARGATLTGGTGNDTLQGGLAATTFSGGDGADSLLGSSKADLLMGGIGDDTIVGGKGADRAFGDAGNDSILGSAGDDLLYGDAGNDTLFGNDGNDSIGGDGEDRLEFQGGSSPAVITGNDSLNGGNGDDWLTGGDESATLHDANNGTDTLTGGAGNDILDARGWDANPDDLITDRAAGDIVPMENHTRQATAPEIALGEDAYVTHTHARIIINITVAGVVKTVNIEDGIGDFVSPTLANTSPAMHVHETQEGVIHMHDLEPHIYTLGEFFRGWGVTMDETHIGRYTATEGHTLSFSVQHGDNGSTEPITDPYAYIIQGAFDYLDGDIITITYT